MHSERILSAPFSCIPAALIPTSTSDWLPGKLTTSDEVNLDRLECDDIYHSYLFYAFSVPRA